jgi:TPR repeat protein
LIYLSDFPLISAILAAALAAILWPRQSRANDSGPALGLEPEVDFLPAVARALQIIGVAPVEALKGVSVNVEDDTVFDLGAILPPGLRPAYEKARGEMFGKFLDVGPLMAELTGPIAEGADRGEPAMALLLAHLLKLGLGVPQDEDHAYRLTRQAAEAGDLVAASILGDLLIEGIGTLPDFGEAVVWIRRALPLGAAKTRLALWRTRFLRPDLVSQAEAVESVTIASALGDPVARNAIDKGMVERDYSVDGWRLAAREGGPGESLILGMLLLFGPPGERDEAEGLAALQQAARGRDERAAWILSRLYREGARGLPRDAAEADKWALAAVRFQDERFGLSPRPGAPGSPGPVTRKRKAGGAGQSGKRKKTRKSQKAKKPRSRG